MNSKKLLGIKIIGNYNKWFGLITILIGVFCLFTAASPATLERLEQQNMSMSFYRIKAIWAMLLGIIMFILGNGILWLKNWARKGTIAFSILGILTGLISFFTAGVFLPKRIIGTVAGIIINGIIVYYLFRSEIKILFKEIGLKGIFWF